MIRAILFDLDDTLLDFETPPTRRAPFEQAAERSYAYLTAKGCSLPNFEHYCRICRRAFRRADFVNWLTGHEQGARRPLRRVCVKLGIQQDHATLAKLAWRWYEPLADSAGVTADVLPTLATLREAGIKLGLVVNTVYPGEVIDRHLEIVDLLEFFPVRVYSSEIGSRKPHPRIFRAALDELGTSPAETLFVSDERPDLIGARRIGMSTVLRHAHPNRRARRTANHVIQGLSEILDLPDLRHVRDSAQDAVRAA